MTNESKNDDHVLHGRVAEYVEMKKRYPAWHNDRIEAVLEESHNE